VGYAGAEEGKKVATKVATNSETEKETGGCIAATACDSTIQNGRGEES